MINIELKQLKDNVDRGTTLSLLYGLIFGIVLLVLLIIGSIQVMHLNIQSESDQIIQYHDKSIADSIALTGALYRFQVIALRMSTSQSDNNFNLLNAEALDIIRQEEKLVELQSEFPTDEFTTTTTRLSNQLRDLQTSLTNVTDPSALQGILSQYLKPALHSAEQLHLLHQVVRENKFAELVQKHTHVQSVTNTIIVVFLVFGIPLIVLILQRVKKGLVLLRSSMLELANTQERLKKLAYYDPLTSLPNRRMFHDQVEVALCKSARGQKLCALLFLDIDEFKRVNDSLGHKVGDELLCTVGNRIVDSLRATDVVSRISGDEFNILLENIDSDIRAAQLASKIIENLTQPILIENHELFITASIGITIYPNDAKSSVELLKYADLAMYQVKQKGKNSYQFYNRSLNDIAIANMKMENRLRHAYKHQLFHLCYQPQIDLASKKVVAFEALIRWKDDEEGLIPPSKFIPIAESTGMIEAIGKWVFTKACSDLATLMACTSQDVRVAINVSPRQLRDKGFLAFISKQIEHHRVAPKNIEIEITESVLMEKVEEHNTILNKIKNLGIHIAIDDFGTGYSSFSYLNRLSVDVLKIDRSFVENTTENEKDRKIVSAIIAMAHNLNLRVIAEGVETQEQLELLSQKHCDICQGYLFSKPLPLSEIQNEGWRINLDAKFNTSGIAHIAENNPPLI